VPTASLSTSTPAQAENRGLMYMAPNVTEVHEIEFPKLELAKGEFNPRLRKCDHGVSVCRSAPPSRGPPARPPGHAAHSRWNFTRPTIHTLS